MPDQIQRGFGEKFCSDYLDKSEEIIYLVRKNFTEQVLSRALANLTGEYHPWHEGNEAQSKFYRRYPGKISYTEYLEDRYTAKPQSSIRLDINQFNYYERELLFNLEAQSKFYRRYPGKISYLEDRYDTNKKYKKSINILNAGEFNSTINVLEYF